MNIQLKSVLRRPIMAILLILLLGAVSFGFVSKVTEYLVINDAIEETSKYYKSIGYLSTGNPYDGDVTEGARILADSDLVSVNNVIRFCRGTLDDIYNADLDGLISQYTGTTMTETLFWGNLLDIKHLLPDVDQNVTKETYIFKFQVEEQVYGYPEYAPTGEYFTISYYPQEADIENFAEEIDSLKTNQTYGVRASYSGENSYNAGMVLCSAIPEKKLFLNEGDDLEAKQLLEEDAVQNLNRKRVTLYGTRDMSTMPFVQEITRDGYLVEGRWLTKEDNENKIPVCVIQQGLAETRNLNVGDKLKITMSNEILEYSCYPMETTIENLPQDTVTQEFEIVGIFNRDVFVKGNVTYPSLDVYIPDSCMPSDYDMDRVMLTDNSVYEASYNFVLTSPEKEAEFVQQYTDKMESLGYSLNMVENGWAGFSAAAVPIKQSVAYSAIMFLVTQIVCLFLVSFLYFKQHQREFAISRALGIAKKNAVSVHLVPLMMLGICGIGTGSIIGWNYASVKVEKTFFDILNENVIVHPELSVKFLISLIFLSVFFLAAAGMLYFIILSRKPVLEILQGNSRRKKSKNLSKERKSQIGAVQKENAEQNGKDTKFSYNIEEEKKNGNTVAGKSMLHFMQKHMARSKGTSSLPILIAIIFLLTLGWLLQSIHQTNEHIDELYCSISVDMEIIKKNSSIYSTDPCYISGNVVDEVLNSGFIQESYLAAFETDASLKKSNGKAKFSKFSLYGISSEEILNVKEKQGIYNSKDIENGKGEITYSEDWDDSMFGMFYEEDMNCYPIIVQEDLLEYLDVSYGDKMILQADSKEVSVVIAGSYTGNFNNLYVIKDENKIFMPLSLLKRLYKGTLYYSNAEFTLKPEMNKQLSEFREMTTQLAEQDNSSKLDISFRIWDEELRMTAEPMEKNLTLMKVLYPIAQIVAMLAGGMVSMLLLLQSAKRAAILRVLGIPAKTVRKMLGAEQLTLGVIGTVLGILLCIILGKWNIELLYSIGLYLLGLLSGTVIGCILVTNKKPLELLQVKE